MIRERLRDPLIPVLAVICALLLFGVILNRISVTQEVQVQIETVPMLEVSDRMLPEPDERGFIAFEDGVHHVVHIRNLGENNEQSY